MSWNGLPAWDGNRSLFFQSGILFALVVVFVIINHTEPLKINETQTHSELEIQMFNFTELTHNRDNSESVKPAPIKPKPQSSPIVTERIQLDESSDFDYSETFEISVSENQNLENGNIKDAVPTETKADNDRIFTVTEVMPYLSQCNTILHENQRRQCTAEILMEHTYTNIRYPPMAREQGIEGTVIIVFVIDRNGKMTDLEIVKDIGGGCGSEVLKALKKLTAWSPGLHNGNHVNVKFTLPVKFSLQK